MFTLIIVREELVDRDYDGYVKNVVPARLEINYAESADSLKDSCTFEIKSMAYEEVKQGCYEPQFILLHDGVPVFDLDISTDRDKYLELEKSFIEEYRNIVKNCRVEVARLSNNARLERERKEKENLENKERSEMVRLLTKYGVQK